jgi:hypothetical protein
MKRLTIRVVEACAFACPRCGLVHRATFTGWRKPHELICDCGTTLNIVEDLDGAFGRIGPLEFNSAKVADSSSGSVVGNIYPAAREQAEERPNSLWSLAYFSTAMQTLSDVNLRRLFLRAADFNDAVNVTGLLLFADNVFMQTIEGSADDVNTVYKRIADDSTHQIDEVFVNSTIERRVYPAWAMMASSFPLDATLVSFLQARKESPSGSFTVGQTVAIQRTLDFVNRGAI